MFISQKSGKWLFVVAFVLTAQVDGLNSGDYCDHPSKEQARCLYRSQCPEATILIERGYKPVHCEGRYEEDLVCCKEVTGISAASPLLPISNESYVGSGRVRVSSYEGTKSSSEGTGSSAEGTGSNAKGTESNAKGTGSNAKGTESNAEGTGSSAEDKVCTGSACLKSFGSFPSESTFPVLPPPFRPYNFNTFAPNSDAFPIPAFGDGNFWGNGQGLDRTFWEQFNSYLKSSWQKENSGKLKRGQFRPPPPEKKDVSSFGPSVERSTSQRVPVFFPEEDRKLPTTRPMNNNFRPPQFREFPKDPYPNEGSGFGQLQDVRVSQRMCAKYLRLTTTILLNPQGLSLRPVNTEFRVSHCSKKSVPLIINGVNALAGEFPHMAVLGYLNSNNETDWDCGGSLISEYFVLTAAHCVATAKGNPVVVRLGELNLVTPDGVETRDYAIAEYITHDGYNSFRFYDDIALLRLRDGVVFSDHIRPACLPPENFNFTSAIATGWGLTDIGGDRSDVLQKIQLNPIPTFLCRQNYGNEALTNKLFKGIDYSSQMCYGKDGGGDTSQGDSGGPLQVSDDNCNYYVVGVTSFGKSFGKKRSAGVYTKVQHYLGWIERVVWPNS